MLMILMSLVGTKLKFCQVFGHIIVLNDNYSKLSDMFFLDCRQELCKRRML